MASTWMAPGPRAGSTTSARANTGAAGPGARHHARDREGGGPAGRTYDFGLRYDRDLADAQRELFQDAFLACWRGRAEADGFNQLVLAASLSWQEISVLRAYARWLRQVG